MASLSDDNVRQAILTYAPKDRVSSKTVNARERQRTTDANGEKKNVVHVNVIRNLNGGLSDVLLSCALCRMCAVFVFVHGEMSADNKSTPLDNTAHSFFLSSIDSKRKLSVIIG